MMNERIKELAVQVGWPSDSMSEHMYHVVGTDFAEEFTKLIVAEACLVLEAGKPGVNQVPAEVALDLMQKNLRAYFGVEK